MDIHEYIKQLESKLEAARQIAADMGVPAKPGRKTKSAGKTGKTGKRTGPTTAEVILEALKGGGDVAVKDIKKACVKAGKSGGAVSVALNSLRKAGKVARGSKTGLWKLKG